MTAGSGWLLDAASVETEEADPSGELRGANASAQMGARAAAVPGVAGQASGGGANIGASLEEGEAPGVSRVSGEEDSGGEVTVWEEIKRRGLVRRYYKGVTKRGVGAKWRSTIGHGVFAETTVFDTEAEAKTAQDVRARVLRTDADACWSSYFRGVTWHQRRWAANIRVDGKCVSLGRHEGTARGEVDAALAHDLAVRAAGRPEMANFEPMETTVPSQPCSTVTSSAAARSPTAAATANNTAATAHATSDTETGAARKRARFDTGPDTGRDSECRDSLSEDSDLSGSSGTGVSGADVSVDWQPVTDFCYKQAVHILASQRNSVEKGRYGARPLRLADAKGVTIFVEEAVAHRERIRNSRRVFGAAQDHWKLSSELKQPQLAPPVIRRRGTVLAGRASGSGLLARALSYQRYDATTGTGVGPKLVWIDRSVAGALTVVDEPTVDAGHLNDATAAETDAVMVDAPIISVEQLNVEAAAAKETAMLRVDERAKKAVADKGAKKDAEAANSKSGEMILHVEANADLAHESLLKQDLPIKEELYIKFEDPFPDPEPRAEVDAQPRPNSMRSRAPQARGRSPAANDAGWERWLAQLKAYAHRHGDCNVPRRWADDPQLGRWVDSQRYCKKKLDRGEPSLGMTAARVAKLDALGFAWELSAAAISHKASQGAPDDAAGEAHEATLVA
jgi:hypothetical protein